MVLKERLLTAHQHLDEKSCSQTLQKETCMGKRQEALRVSSKTHLHKGLQPL